MTDIGTRSNGRSNSVTGLDAQLCFALYAASNAVIRAWRPRLAVLGLTYPQYIVLLALWQDGTLATGQIAQRLSLPQNALTPIIDRLERAGLVTRDRDPDDRRVVHVTLTAQGRALDSALGAAQEQVRCDTGLSVAALDALRSDLRRLAAQIEARTGAEA